jgi:hypothetical protein
MIHDDDGVRTAAERCARLESWLQVEKDPAEREKIAEALRDARDTLAKEVHRYERERGIEPKGEPNADRMFPDGNVTDFLKRLDQAAEAKKDAGAAPASDTSEAEAKADTQEAVAEADAAAAPELERVRELEPPAAITELPEYQELYEEALDRYTNEITAQLEASVARSMEDIAEADLPQGEDVDSIGRTAAASYRYAPEPEAAPELAKGAEIEGTVKAIEQRDGGSFYVVEGEDGRLVAVPVDEDLDLEPGDDIAASRDRDGTYGVSRGADYGMG